MVGEHGKIADYRESSNSGQGSPAGYPQSRWADKDGESSDVKNISADLLNPSTLQGLVVLGAAFFVAASVVVVLIRRTARRVMRHLTDVTAARFLSALAQVLAYLVAFVLYAHLVPELRAIGTALLAGVSVVSVVAGLAAQNTLGNLIAGLSLVLYRPFIVGRFVFHCHILEHEDKGMMATLRVLPQPGGRP